MPKPQTVQELDPAVALRAGRFDPGAVLILWCARKAFYPLLWLGLIFATVGGRAGEINEAGSDRQLMRCGPFLRWASILLFVVYLVTFVITVEP